MIVRIPITTVLLDAGDYNIAGVKVFIVIECGFCVFSNIDII